MALFSTLSIGSVYYICGFNSGADNYFLAILCSILISHIGVAYGLLFSIILKTEKLAFDFIAVINIPFLLVGGQVVNSGSLIREFNPSS